MASNAYLYRMPSGIPGTVGRESVSTIEGLFADSTKPFSAYGVPGKIASGKFVPLVSGDAATDVYGLLVRPYPTTGGVNAGSFTGSAYDTPRGTGVPPSEGQLNVMRRGYMTVLNTQGTPALNGQVYVRVGDTDSTGFAIGSLSASQDTTTPADTVALAGCVFTGEADADGNVEIAYNI